MARRIPRSSSPPPDAAPRPWAAPALLSSIFVALTAASWRRWGDVFIDFGHELYIPWQLAEGRVLYRDIAYFMGPLSQYFNAALFAVFGTSLTTLVLANLALLAGITAAIHVFFSRAMGRPAATLAGVVFLCVFGFAHLNRVGNYNYVTPYLHEQTHGVALALLLLLLLERAARRPSLLTTAAAGATLGLAFLTKAEAFVPALACAVAAGVLLYVRRRPPTPRAAAVAGVFAGSALLPVAAAFAFLAAQMPAADAARGVAGNWVYVLDRGLVVGDPYYANNLGLSSVTTQVRAVLGAAAGVLAFVAAALLLERVAARHGREAGIAGGVLVGVALAVGTSYATWSRTARVLPLVCAAAAAVYLRAAWRARAEPGFQRDFMLALWSVLSLGSLGKMILNTRLDHYGFALAMPGTLLSATLLVFAVPRRWQGAPDAGAAWRAAALAAVTVATGSILSFSAAHYRLKTHPVGAGEDRLYTIDPRVHPDGACFAAALDTLRDQMRPGATLAVLPDGVLLNYLLRRPNPTPYTLMTPWEMRAFGGEDAVFARIAVDPPDYVVLANLDMSEYGPRYFGFDDRYGRRIRLWLEQNYELLADIGETDETERHWLRIYRRPEGQLAGRLPR